MMKVRWFAIAGASVLGFAPVWFTSAQAPAQQPSAQEPSLALYCRGPLSTFRTEGGKVIKTPFKWAKAAATKENPGAGECAWADLPIEKPGGDSVILGNLGPFDNIPVGTIGKVCVTKAAGQSNDLIVRQIVRQLGHETSPFHRPPFSADGCPS